MVLCGRPRRLGRCSGDGLDAGGAMGDSAGSERLESYGGLRSHNIMSSRTGR